MIWTSEFWQFEFSRALSKQYSKRLATSNPNKSRGWQSAVKFKLSQFWSPYQNLLDFLCCRLKYKFDLCHWIFKNVVFLLKNALVLEKFENFWTSVYIKGQTDMSHPSLAVANIVGIVSRWLVWHNFLGLLWVCEALNNCNASWSHDDELRHEEEVAEQQ